MRLLQYWLVPALVLFTSSAIFAQQDSAAGKLQEAVKSQSSSQTKSPEARRPQAGAAIGQSGLSLQSDESVFLVAAGLNACGYNAGLSNAAPVRLQIREEMEQEIAASPAAADARAQLCRFVQAHDLGDPVRTLSQYISLALMLEPGPDLKLSSITEQLPPDASNVRAMLPLLAKFADAAHLHALWVAARPQYEELIAPLREPITKMLLSLSLYLGQTESGNSDRRFLVIVEPMLGGGIVSARVYGLDYLMVLAPPANEDQRVKFNQDVEHFYLQFAVDPVLLGYPRAMQRLAPILKSVREAPLEEIYREEISALVGECLIRAIEARTMDTGIAVAKHGTERLSGLNGRQALAAEQQDEAIRLATVQRDEEQGFVLTKYFYDKLAAFQTHSETLKNAMGDIIYSIDPDLTVRHAKNIVFSATAAPVRPRPAGAKPSLQTRDNALSADEAAPADLVAKAEQQLAEGKLAEASTTALSALDKRQGDPGRATYVLAEAQIMQGNAEDAQAQFTRALTLTHDPHTLAWSHIYLGRIADLEGYREQAVQQYKAALAVKSGLPDADSAAQRGIAQPFTAPRREQP